MVFFCFALNERLPTPLYLIRYPKVHRFSCKAIERNLLVSEATSEGRSDEHPVPSCIWNYLPKSYLVEDSSGSMLCARNVSVSVTFFPVRVSMEVLK